MKKVIYLITTLGCYACRYQKTLLKSAIENRKDIELVLVDFTKAPEYIRTNVSMQDFPVTVITEDDVIKMHFTGTRTVTEIKNILEDLNY